MTKRCSGPRCRRSVQVRFKCQAKRKRFCSNPCRLRALHAQNAKPRTPKRCPECRGNFTLERGPHAKTRHCSRRCGNAAGARSRTGIMNGHWKGGVSPSTQGYTLITSGPNAGKLKHRVVVERRLGRPLRSDEIVHHRDHNKGNDRSSNLEVMNRSTHASLHLKERWRRS